MTSTTRTGRRSSRDTRARTRRTGVVGAVGGIAAALAIASPAAAAQPITIEDTTYVETETQSAEEFVCGVEATFHTAGVRRITAFVDRDGALLRVQGHIGGTTTVTTAYGEVVNRWRENGRLAPDGTLTWSGNSFNVHAGAGGVLLNQSGRWIVDDNTGEVLSTAGPQQTPETDPEALCGVLAP